MLSVLGTNSPYAFPTSAAPWVALQVRLLQALSGRQPVDLYLLTPCPDLWERCSARRLRLSDALALADPLDSDWLLRAPPLEARFGRLGAEFQQLLEGTGEVQFGAWREDDLFLRSITTPGPDAPPLLHQLQDQLATGATPGGMRWGESDHSLEFHACPGALRQVQIVRDRLLQLMAADPRLEPRDILVMTPQVDRLAPLVGAVFGDSEATGVALPWRLTDRSQQAEGGIGRSLLALLQLGGARLTASGLEGVLACAALLERFQLTAEEGGQVRPAVGAGQAAELVEQPLQLTAGATAVTLTVDVEVAVPGGHEVQALGPAAHEGHLGVADAAGRGRTGGLHQDQLGINLG
jgi:exodeoxyribonuclease V gamma subunit